jgi:hypothetical protein
VENLDTLILGPAGIVGTTVVAVASPLLQMRVARRRQIFELKVSAYSDAVLHVQTIQAGIEWLTEEPSLRAAGAIPGEDAAATLPITARIRLWGSPAALETFLKVLSCNQNLWVPISDEGYGRNVPRQSRDDRRIVLALEAVKEFVAASAKDLGLGRGSLGHGVPMR